MSNNTNWTRQQLLVAFYLYCQIPYGKIHSKNPDIIKYSEMINRTPSALAMKLVNIASLDPVITSTNRTGLRNASSADKKIWNEIQNDWDDFVFQSYKIITLLKIDHEAINSKDDQDKQNRLIDLQDTERSTERKIRIGQDFFRKSVLSAYNCQCCITGLSEEKLLVASHIIPWAKNIENRLNPQNGLLLSALHDKAFDIGIITINDDMTMKISKNKHIKQKDKFYEENLLKYDGKEINLPDKFQPNIEFLAYHREHIFEKQGNTEL